MQIYRRSKTKEYRLKNSCGRVRRPPMLAPEAPGHVGRPKRETSGTYICPLDVGQPPALDLH